MISTESMVVVVIGATISTLEREFHALGARGFISSFDMKGGAIAVIVVCLVLTTIETGGRSWPKRETYTTRWDKVNMDGIIANKRLLHYYYNCLMSIGPCPPDGREIKRMLPEALRDGCAKCTQRQVNGAIKLIKYIREFEPQKFDILANKYDPDGRYRRQYFHSGDENHVNSGHEDYYC